MLQPQVKVWAVGRGGGWRVLPLKYILGYKVEHMML